MHHPVTCFVYVKGWTPFSPRRYPPHSPIARKTDVVVVDRSRAWGDAIRAGIRVKTIIVEVTASFARTPAEGTAIAYVDEVISEAFAAAAADTRSKKWPKKRRSEFVFLTFNFVASEQGRNKHQAQCKNGERELQSTSVCLSLFATSTSMSFVHGRTEASARETQRLRVVCALEAIWRC